MQTKFKLVIFYAHDVYPTTCSNPEGTVESFRGFVESTIGKVNKVDKVLAELGREGAHYSSVGDYTFVLVK